MNKIKGLAMRRLGTEAVIVAESLEMVNFDRLVALNPSAAYVWERLADVDFDVDGVAVLLVARYDVDLDTARADAKELLDCWLRAGIIE